MSNFSSSLIVALLVNVFLASVVSAASSSCASVLVASDGTQYNIESLVGITVNATAGTSSYKVSICNDNIPQCGLCSSAGFCEVEQFYDNCVGLFASATGYPNGRGVELAYPNGEFGRAGVVSLVCDPNAGVIGDVSVLNGGNLMVVNSSIACPIGSPSGDDCDAQGSNCKGCLANPECAYCLDSMTCISPTGSCGDYWKNPAMCSKLNVCAQQPDCDECTSYATSNGCFWCPSATGGQGACLSSSMSCGAGKITNPSFCGF